MALVNLEKMIKNAINGKYAIPAFNINNLEWTKSILKGAQSMNSPVILGVSEGAAKYMCGFELIVGMVKSLIKYLNITIDVAIHLDHGSYDGCKKALEAGFTSIMFDGSHLPFDENIRKTKELIELSKKYNATIETEVGAIGGEEDGITGDGEYADVNECIEMSKLPITLLACGIGNIHGLYPSNWKGLNFELLKEIREKTKLPLVLHGGTGIPEDMIKKAINLGVCKINVNTECQIAFTKATREYFENEKDKKGKGYDPRKVLADGAVAIEEVVKEKITLFGSNNKN